MKNQLLSSFNSFKNSLAPESKLNRRKSLAFIGMFKRFGFTMALVLCFCTALKAQTKPESTRADTLINKKDLATIQRNMYMIQQVLHTVHLDALTRDKADSVYYQNMALITPKPEEKKLKK